jgi:hypothetical protein
MGKKNREDSIVLVRMLLFHRHLCRPLAHSVLVSVLRFL